jgi:hypothetical protein
MSLLCSSALSAFISGKTVLLSITQLPNYPPTHWHPSQVLKDLTGTSQASGPLKTIRHPDDSLCRRSPKTLVIPTAVKRPRALFSAGVGRRDLVLAFPAPRSSRFSMCLHGEYPRPIILPAASALPIWAISATIRVYQPSSAVRFCLYQILTTRSPIFRLPRVPSIRNLNNLAWDIPSHQCFCFALGQLLFAICLITKYQLPLPISTNL